MTTAHAPELLAPAGNWDCVRAAVANGADAVYFGLPRFNARLRADNFTEAELPEVVAFCHRHGVKAYVAFNTLVFTGEFADAGEYLRLLNRARVDALIVQDVGLVRLARELTPELPIHASTQMTITSPEGVEFAQELGIERVVLARELALRELEKFASERMPLEVFVHGALCVAYSGQCLTSESLGQRSANRGECAQACRMPYELIVDGAVRDLGDRRYLLSPQDLAAVDEIPALLERGVTNFKIEGRLKSPEYVAAVCQVYRKAIDAALDAREFRLGAADRYQLEMTFSRGLYSGWMHGVNHQELVCARFGKKRGPFVGRIERVGRDFVEVRSEIELKPGDGVVFDTGGDTDAEQGGRIFEIKGGRLFFQHGHLDFARLKAGDRVWKTDDPALMKRLQQSFAGRLAPRRSVRVDLRITGRTGEALEVRGSTGDAGAPQSVRSNLPLQTARTAPLTTEKLREHLGRFGESGYALGELSNELEGDVILPIGELNRLRRELTFQLDTARAVQRPESDRTLREILEPIRLPAGRVGVPPAVAGVSPTTSNEDQPRPQERPTLRVLCRTMAQLEATLAAGVREIYVDFEDIRRGKDAVRLVREAGATAQIFLATPRIQKAGEEGFFKVIENAAPDGVLIRNLGAIEHFRSSPLRRIGDFSLNVANPLTADWLIRKGLERVTISYDLNIDQVLDLLGAAPPAWFELTLHQHMPMFHMEHCVFAAFLSNGTSFLDCGRPCDSHRVHLRDRVGMEHPLRADVGCRNTLFNAVPQTGAGFFPALDAAGLRDFRIELLEEDAGETQRVINAYQALLAGEQNAEQSWRALRAQSQLGVTRGTLEARGP
ncbi:MAG: family peptidase [Chthoniobacter sp.]|jgi:putative protease|nr:family peptidase [Chthoniobacter sp.]